MWMLKKGVGDTIDMPDDGRCGRPRTDRRHAADSPFQSELVMADAAFRRLFPKHEGFGMFLIAHRPENEAAVARVLEVGLRPNGLIATPRATAWPRYQAVIGAYLSDVPAPRRVRAAARRARAGGGHAPRGVGAARELALLRAFGYTTRAVRIPGPRRKRSCSWLSASGSECSRRSLGRPARRPRRGGAVAWLAAMAAGVLAVGAGSWWRDSRCIRGPAHPRRCERNDAMIRLGILDFDTSHCVEFTKRLNHVGIAKDQCVEGAKVVVGCPGKSKLSPERIPGSPSR